LLDQNLCAVPLSDSDKGSRQNTSGHGVPGSASVGFLTSSDSLGELSGRDVNLREVVVRQPKVLIQVQSLLRFRNALAGFWRRTFIVSMPR